MAVREKAVGLEIFIHFDEVEIAARVFARAAGAGLAVANDAGAGSKQASLGKRPQGKNHAGGVAAGIRNQASLGDLVRIELRNAVYSFRNPSAVGPLQLVPAGQASPFAHPE